MPNSAELSNLAPNLAQPNFHQLKKYGAIVVSKVPVHIYYYENFWWWVWTGKDETRHTHRTSDPLAWQNGTPERNLLAVKVSLTSC